MAPMEQVEEVAVVDLITAEMTEQSLWETHIPAWHPRNDGTDAGDDAGDDPDDGSGDDDKDGAGSGGDTGGSAPSQEDLDKAYEKLRAVEKERDQLNVKVKKSERAGLDELERTKQELADARLEAAANQEKLDSIEREKSVVTMAKTMKFLKPDKAARLVPASATDAKTIKAALKELAEDFPEMIDDGSPPPPINGDQKNNGATENDRMNSAIRAAAGRG